MSYERARICRICFAACFLLGTCFLLMVLVEDAMASASLDVVLTREELRDEAIRDRTLNILTKAGGMRWIFWAFAGVATVLASGIGYRAACEPADPRKPHRPDSDDLE